VTAGQILWRQILAMLSGILLAGLLFFRLWDSPFSREWYQAALLLSPIGLAAVFPRARLSALGGLMLGSALAVIASTVLELYRDPSCCNLWPIGIVLVFLFCLPATLLGGFASYLLGRTGLPRPFYVAPLALSLAIPALFPYIEKVQQDRLQTVTIPKILNDIYRAEMAYAAGRPDGAFACDGKQLPGVENLGWRHVTGETLNNGLTVRYYYVTLKCLNDARPRSFRVTTHAWDKTFRDRGVPNFFIDPSGELIVTAPKPDGSYTGKKPSPSGPAAAPNLIVNGGFEVPVAQAFLTIVAPSSFPGWTVSTGGVDVSAASFYASASGAQSLDLNSIVSGSVSQDIATTAGVTYVLTFSFAANPLAGNPCCPAPATKRMEVRWGTTVVGTLDHDTTGRSATTVGWRKISFKVVGSGADKLSFVSLTPGSAGPTIDDVRLVAEQTP